MSNKKTSKEAIEFRERVKKAIELRALGFSLDEIAAELKWTSKQAVSKAIINELKRNSMEGAAEYRQIQLMRVEQPLAKIMEKAKKGSIPAVNSLIKISKRISEITGCDVPLRIANTDAAGNDVPRGEVYLYIPDNGRDVSQDQKEKKKK